MMVDDKKEKSKGRPRGNRRERDDEFDQKMIDIARVTRVMAGGKRMNFRACVVIGDHKGRVGMGLRKGADVSLAINKAVTAAKKHLIKVTTVNETIPCRVVQKYGAAVVMLKPAPVGSGVIAGGAVRAVLDLAGIKNIVSKMLGSKNKVNNVMATLKALEQLNHIAIIRKVKSTK